MFHRRKIRGGVLGTCSLAQRMIAFLLSVLMLVLVFDPLWECHDHLDDLRHLGAHGLLLVLLIIACAGISLLKTFNFLPPNFASILFGGALPQRPSPGRVDSSAAFAIAADYGAAPLPLRI